MEQTRRLVEAVNKDEDFGAIREAIPIASSVDVLLSSDFAATYAVGLENGAKLTVDVRSRPAGCSSEWKGLPGGERLGPLLRMVPEVSLEVWSSMRARKPGWIFDWSGDLVLFRWDRSDTSLTYLFSATMLRVAFMWWGPSWIGPKGPALSRPAPHKRCRVLKEGDAQVVTVPIDMVSDSVECSRVRLLPQQAVAPSG
jgi:hypothetical protein